MIFYLQNCIVYMHGIRLQRGGHCGLPDHRLPPGAPHRHHHQQFCALQRAVRATTQRATKLFLGADSENASEKLILPMDDYKSYCAALMKVYRKANHMTQKEFAERLGIKHITLRAWEQNVASPPYEVWRQIKLLLFDGLAG